MGKNCNKNFKSLKRNPPREDETKDFRKRMKPSTSSDTKFKRAVLQNMRQIVDNMEQILTLWRQSNADADATEPFVRDRAKGKVPVEKPQPRLNLGGNEAREKYDLFVSPFTDEILEAKPPPNFKMPKMELYDGTKVSLDHIEMFNDWMNLYGYSDAIKCRAFCLTLTGQARTWYFRCLKREGSISSFKELAKVFLEWFFPSTTALALQQFYNGLVASS